MCTILYCFGQHPEFPLVLAANRDEYYARHASAPQILNGSTRILCGIDLQAGGTWLGANDAGIVVGLTNQRTLRPPDPRARSRGDVVRRSLAARTLDEVSKGIAALDPTQYNPFNLLYGDVTRLIVAYVRSDGVTIEQAPRGVHVLPNDRIGSPGFPKAARARALAAPFVAAPWSELASGFAGVLADHQLPPRDQVPSPPPGASIDAERLYRNQAICTHGEVYGTCSSSIIALGPSGVAHYLFADGPPCKTAFKDHAHLLT